MAVEEVVTQHKDLRIGMEYAMSKVDTSGGDLLQFGKNLWQLYRNVLAERLSKELIPGISEGIWSKRPA